MVIIAALLLVGITVFVILQPVISGEEAPLWSVGEEPSEAQFRKRVFLLQLRDAEYEYAMGKLGEEDYQTLRQEISGEALAAIRAEEAENQVGSGLFEGPTDAELEEEIATVRSRLSGGYFCSNCGHPNPAGSRFCGDCGTPMKVPETPQSS
ncbi:MAG: c-type cytochrome biogenesis protein CcmI [Gemmatimonadota bacterium]